LAGIEQGNGSGNPMIEAQACLLGLHYAKEAGLVNPTVEGDCVALINLLKSSRAQDTFIGFIVMILFFSLNLLVFSLR